MQDSTNSRTIDRKRAKCIFDSATASLYVAGRKLDSAGGEGARCRIVSKKSAGVSRRASVLLLSCEKRKNDYRFPWSCGTVTVVDFVPLKFVTGSTHASCIV